MDVRGEFVWPAAVTAMPAVTARIRVEDVSRADGRATVVGETVLTGITAAAVARGFVSFSIEVADLSPRSEYALRVHLDVDGDGAVSAGDWITTERVRVSRDTMIVPRVQLRQVG